MTAPTPVRESASLLRILLRARLERAGQMAVDAARHSDCTTERDRKLFLFYTAEMVRLRAEGDDFLRQYLAAVATS